MAKVSAFSSVTLAMGELYSQEFDKDRRVTATMRKLERIERQKMDKRAGKSGQA